MKLVDDNGKLFGKLNLVDVGIILLVIFAIVAISGKTIKEQTLDKEQATIRYTLCAEGVRQQSVDAIKKNSEDIKDAEKDEAIGRIVEVRTEKAKKINPLPNGTFVESEYQDKFDLYVTIEAEGTISENGYFLSSGKKIMYGDTIGINNNYSQMFGMVEYIEVVK